MKTIGATAIGIVLSLALTYPGVTLVLDPIIEATAQSPESLMGYSYFVIYPIALFLSSIVTGHILGSQIKRGILRNAKYLPGLYASIPYAIGLFTAPNLLFALLLAACLNVMMSSLGLAIGSRIRDRIQRRSGQVSA